jgi:hypothetical protein
MLAALERAVATHTERGQRTVCVPIAASRGRCYQGVHLVAVNNRPLFDRCPLAGRSAAVPQGADPRPLYEI